MIRLDYGSFLHVAGATRAEAAATFRALPLRERKTIAKTCAGISYLDNNRMRHTMVWTVLNDEPRRRVVNTLQENA